MYVSSDLPQLSKLLVIRCPHCETIGRGGSGMPSGLSIRDYHYTKLLQFALSTCNHKQAWQTAWKEGRLASSSAKLGVKGL